MDLGLALEMVNGTNINSLVVCTSLVVAMIATVNGGDARGGAVVTLMGMRMMGMRMETGMYALVVAGVMLVRLAVVISMVMVVRGDGGCGLDCDGGGEGFCGLKWCDRRRCSEFRHLDCKHSKKRTNPTSDGAACRSLTPTVRTRGTRSQSVLAKQRRTALLNGDTQLGVGLTQRPRRRGGERTGLSVFHAGILPLILPVSKPIQFGL